MNKHFLLKLIFLLSVLLPGYRLKANAQLLTGTVLETGTNKPVPGASIYFEGTFKITATDNDGNFSIDISGVNKQIPLTVSSIGYYTEKIADHEQPGLKIFLKKKVAELHEVVINSNTISREKELKIFKRAFLGVTTNGRQTRIMNEDDIRFTYSKKTGTLKAYCDDPLIIYNKNLGYTITYYLKQFWTNDAKTLFDGGHFFKEDQQIDSEVIKKEREKTYFGSRMHFIRALWSNTLAENGFMVIDNLSNEIKNEDIVSTDNDSKFLKYNDTLYIVYLNRYRSSLVKTTIKPVYIDKNGNYNDEGLLWWGAIAIQRVGDLLPFEYTPAKAKP